MTALEEAHGRRVQSAGHETDYDIALNRRAILELEGLIRKLVEAVSLLTELVLTWPRPPASPALERPPVPEQKGE